MGGESTRTYAFNTGNYGLTIKPPEFQKIMDTILHETRNEFTFLYDILIVTKGNKEMHVKKVEEIIQLLDKAGIRLKIAKCKLAQREVEWRGYKLSAAGIQPIEEQFQAITNRLRPKNLRTQAARNQPKLVSVTTDNESNGREKMASESKTN